MFYIHLTIFSLVFLLGPSTAKLTCPPGEVVDDCPVDCPRDYCPKSRYADQRSCPKPKVCPPPQCKCGFNSRRAENGTCIPTRDCPPFPCCGENEQYQACPGFCPGQNCSDATPSGRCPLGNILITVNCTPQCRCIPHYWRDNGKCVAYEDCPNIKNATTDDDCDGSD